MTNFRFQSEVCNSSHDLTREATRFNDFAIVNVKANDIGFIFGI